MKNRVLDLYVREYELKPKGKKVKARAGKSKKAVSASGTDSQGRSTNPYGDGGMWLTE